MLIVNADDFGRSYGVNKGICYAYKFGIVTSTTVMMNKKATMWVQDAIKEVPDLGFGVHLNITSGEPISKPSDIRTLLGDDFRFFRPEEFPFIYEKFDIEDLYREFTAQINTFVAITGKRPTHLDSHYHAAFLFPNALKVILDLAKQYHLPLRRPPSIGKDSVKVIKQFFPNFTIDMAQELSDSLQDILSSTQYRIWPDRFHGDFFGKDATLDHMLDFILNLQSNEVVEIMCHPGYLDNDLLDSGYNAEREVELGILTNPIVKEALNKCQIELGSFDVF